MTKDLLKTLEAMRPDTGADRLWPQHVQAAEQARIMATTSAPTAPAVRSRRVGAVALTAALFAVGALGACAAAATGLMPKAFTDHYYFWKEAAPEPGATAVDPATAERIASIPGPDGTVFSVFEARGAGSQRCVTSVFESAAGAADPGPSEFTDLGSRCRHDGEGGFGDGAGTMVATFGDGGSEVLPKELVYDAVAGTAVRAELCTSTGQVLPTILADGSFFGWFPKPEPGSPRPVLTGYAADGTVVGSIEIGPNF
ncbi:hypothetical protein AB4Z09_27540 [Rhodococcus sp. TAF43]|uniref:hypothetical protein n=1 Tax=unclassified Rhodococcus (in: high G+C Gram-positive bacteria) TaxID=192944 RepID=UPI001582DE18|nr:hypothetical protein [Rhodococcus sp. W8901]QKT11589.1 hypothetical protein HUN07_13335 [Rhodococcus sp. W8901]